jgi:hypothetical protein
MAGTRELFRASRSREGNDFSPRGPRGEGSRRRPLDCESAAAAAAPSARQVNGGERERERGGGTEQAGARGQTAVGACMALAGAGRAGE